MRKYNPDNSFANDINEEAETILNSPQVIQDRLVDAHAEALQFKMLLIENISQDSLNLPHPTQEYKNGESHPGSYARRKGKLVGHTVPLKLTEAFINSITVFEETGKVGSDEMDLTTIQKDSENPLKYYVRTGLTEGLIGYYVDVKDFAHDISPFTTFGKVLFNARKDKDAALVHRLRSRKKQKEHLQNVQLKYILEYGNGRTVPRPYWEKTMQQMYDFKALEQANNLNAAQAEEARPVDDTDDGEGED